MTFQTVFAASSGAASLFQEYIWVFLLVLLLGVFIGLVWGVINSRVKAKYFSNEAERRIKNIIADFKKEKDTSETILRELQVGVLAFGADGRLITGNPSANSLLGVRDVPQTLQGFLNRYGKDNGISLALMLQTNNVTGNVTVKDRIVRIRLTRAQLSMFRNPSWIVIIQDITEQEREDKQRKEFVANVSHELKTPLTTISAYSETLLDWGLEGKSEQEIRKDIARIHDDSKRMDHLVQNLLLLSSIDSRGIRPNMVQYDIVFLLRQVVSRMQVQAQDKKIDLRSSVLSIVPPVFGDPTAIDRILTNLISNAIKYTDHNGRVSVSLQKTDNYISLKVVDNGMGVAKDNLPRLFDRFYRVDATGSRKYGGTGLGLSIAKELTELQGGTISVSSTLGKGSEFVVTIPKAETTYRETLAAILSDSPRTEIIYENARNYLLKAAQEIEMPIYELNKITGEQTEELLSYLLMEEEVMEGRAPITRNSPSPEMSADPGSNARRPQHAPNIPQTPPVVPRMPPTGPQQVPSGHRQYPSETQQDSSMPEQPPREHVTPVPTARHPDRAKVQAKTETAQAETHNKSEKGPPTDHKPRTPDPEQVKMNSRPAYLIEPSPSKRNSDRVAKPISGKPKDPPVLKPIKRNADVVSPSVAKASVPDESREISDRLTKSKIHPDNRQRLHLPNLKKNADDLDSSGSTADKNTKEDKRGT